MREDGSERTVAVTLEPQPELLLLEPHTASQAFRDAQPVLRDVARQLEVHSSKPRAEFRVDAEGSRDFVDDVVHVARLDAGVSGRGLRIAVHRISREDDCREVIAVSQGMSWTRGLKKCLSHPGGLKPGPP